MNAFQIIFIAVSQHIFFAIAITYILKRQKLYKTYSYIILNKSISFHNAYKIVNDC